MKKFDLDSCAHVADFYNAEHLIMTIHFLKMALLDDEQIAMKLRCRRFGTANPYKCRRIHGEWVRTMYKEGVEQGLVKALRESETEKQLVHQDLVWKTYGIKGKVE